MSVHRVEISKKSNVLLIALGDIPDVCSSCFQVTLSNLTCWSYN